MHKISLDLTKTVNGTDVPLTLVAAMRNAIERGFTMADLVFNLTERGYDMVLVPKGMKNGMLVPLSPNELVQRIQKHQAGTHDQSSHGNWANGNGVSELSDDEIKNIFYSSRTVNAAYQAIAKKLGKEMKANVADLSPSEVNAYRGVQNVERDVKRLLDGKIRFGEGHTWGQGIYVDNKREYAAFFGSVLNIKIAESAKIVQGESTWNSAFDVTWQDDTKRVRGQWQSDFIDFDRIKMNVDRYGRAGFSVSDLYNLYWAAKGYDGYSPHGGEMVFFNGGVLTVDSKSMKRIVEKHQAGTHDQQSHGNWAEGKTDVRAGLERLASQFDDFEDFSRAISQDTLRPRAWHIAGKDFQLDPSFEPSGRLGEPTRGGGLFVGSPEYWEDYATGRETVIEFDVSDLTFTSNPQRETGADFFADQSGNQGFFVKPTAFPKLREVGRFTLNEAKERATQQQKEMPKSKAEARKIWEQAQNVTKHEGGGHDQKTHGNWADKLSGTRTGGNRLDIEGSIDLKITPDSQVDKIYAAQDDAFPYDTSGKPKFEKKLSDFNSVAEYDDAYRKYAEEFREFARSTTKNIGSPLAKKHLNGTPKGVKNYIQEFISQDWFVEAFGEAAFYPTLKIQVNKSRGIAGQYFQQYNVETEVGSHGIKINQNFTQDERLLIHEIAHYATAISATESHESHGREFAGNYLYIMRQQLGEKAADKLRKEFDKKGVKYTND